MEYCRFLDERSIFVRVFFDLLRFVRPRGRLRHRVQRSRGAANNEILSHVIYGLAELSLITSRETGYSPYKAVEADVFIRTPRLDLLLRLTAHVSPPTQQANRHPLVIPTFPFSLLLSPFPSLSSSSSHSSSPPSVSHLLFLLIRHFKLTYDSNSPSIDSRLEASSWRACSRCWPRLRMDNRLLHCPTTQLTSVRCDRFLSRRENFQRDTDHVRHRSS